MFIRMLITFILLLAIAAPHSLAQKKGSLNKRLENIEKLLMEQSKRIKQLEEKLSTPQTGTPQKSIRELKQGFIDKNKEGVTNDLSNLAARAFEYYLRPTTKGGGGGSFAGFVVPAQLRSSENGTYSVSSARATQLVLTGTSAFKREWVATMTVDGEGQTSIAYAGFDKF